MKKVEHKFSTNGEMKRCSRCKQWIEISNFYHDYALTDNLHSLCINCCKEYNKELRPKTILWHHSINGKYSDYKSSAKRRVGKEFKLTKNEFAAIVSQPCYYCGELQENFNGVDRVNNKKGYTIDNCVPCCSICNRMKNIYSKEEFIMKCKAIVEKQEVMSYRK